jgi:hypothetical protein
MRHRLTRLGAAAVGIGLTLLAAQLVAAAPAAATTIPPGSVQVVSKLSPFTSDNKSVRADCPAGMRAIGGGGLTAGGADVIISAARPISDATGDGFTVTAQEDQVGVAGTWSVQVFAYCATPPPGYQVVASAPVQLSSPIFGLAEGCPAGKFAIGAGGEITGGAGQVDLGLLPSVDANGQANGTEALAKEDLDGFAGNYAITSYVICASQSAAGDFQVVRANSAFDTALGKQVTVACTNGLRATAGAAFTATTGTHVQFFRPNVTTAPSQISVAASATQSSTSWLVAGFVYCAR